MWFRPSEESPRIFENNFLDALTRTPWFFVPMIYVPASAVLVWYGTAQLGISYLAAAGLFVGGIIAWTFVEYWLHRTLFHWIPDGDWGEIMHFFVHGVHHDWPHDKYRLVMPPVVSATLFLIFLGLWTLVLGDMGWIFHAGFAFGYMVYDVIHYQVHHRKSPNDWVKNLKKHHIMHHFHEDYAELRFGVSTLMWDRVFGTLEPKENPKDVDAAAE